MNVNDEIIKAFDDLPSGAFLTVAQIAAKCDTNTSAITARLFPPIPLVLRGVTASYSETHVRGATKN